jgi:soluble lytic murein transglycosylase
MRRAAGALLLCWPLALAAQKPAPAEVARAESLETAGRPWHAAEAFVAGAGAAATPASAQLLIANARAELAARRYARVVALLDKRSWLADSGGGVGYAILAEAEDRLGRSADAARDYLRARSSASGSRAALLAVRAAVAFDHAGQSDSARLYYVAARSAGLPSIDEWLRLREAGVTQDTLTVDSLLAGLSFPASRRARLYRARALLAAGDSGRAVDALATAPGGALQAAQVALARGDSAWARNLLYHLFASAPLSDDAAAGEALAQGPLPPVTSVERTSLAQVLRTHGDGPAALVQVRRAILSGDSSAATLLLWSDVLSGARKDRDALKAAAAAIAVATDSSTRALATYRRARLLLRMGDSTAFQALSDFARAYPNDSAAVTAFYLAGDRLAEQGDSIGAEATFRELVTAHALDPAAVQARLRLGSWEYRRGHFDRAAEWFQGEVTAGPGAHGAARYWLAKIAAAQGDTAAANAQWTALAHSDSISYYGLRARRAAGLPPLMVGDGTDSARPVVTAGLARLDTLRLAGLDSEADAQVRALVGDPPDSAGLLLAWCSGLASRGWGSLSVRLAWLAAPRAPGDPRVLRAIFPWPNRRAVEAEANEFQVDPYLLAALIRQESVFDREALSRAGARGLAQLMPSTAAYTARGLDLPFAPEWLTVPDLNLHLGAAHLGALLARYHGRVDAAVASYDAGTAPVDRWLARAPGADPDLFIEDVAYVETRGYVRSVLRNWEIYRALYGAN